VRERNGYKSRIPPLSPFALFVEFALGMVLSSSEVRWREMKGEEESEDAMADMLILPPVP